MLSDEGKKAIKGLEWSQQQMRLGNLPDYDQGHYTDIRIVLNLVNEQSKEIEELKEEKAKRSWVHIKENGEVEPLFYVSEDKIKAKIEEYEKMKEATKMDTTYYGEKRRSVIEGLIVELQSLLEKE